MSDVTNKPAVVLVSGGLDSATTLAIARNENYQCHALSFDYGQRHHCELVAAQRVAQSLGAASHRVMTIDLRAFGGSALTADIDVPKDRVATAPHAHGLQSVGVPGSVPITYVPARNTIFLSFALALAETLEADDIFIGVNAVDYSGYPDCRPEYINAFEHMANLATRRGVEGHHMTIHTPLIDQTKAQIIRNGVALGVDYSQTLSCYDPIKINEGGGGGGRFRPCGHCDSCLLRADGFRQAGIPDPAIV